MMFVRRAIAGEGAAMSWIPSDDRSASGLVLCPMLLLGTGIQASVAQEVYRLAYERAQAAMRPSIYEFAQQVCAN
jgi:hypothetical protein